MVARSLDGAQRNPGMEQLMDGRSLNEMVSTLLFRSRFDRIQFGLDLAASLQQVVVTLQAEEEPF